MTTAADAAIWHDVECGSYTADLPLWRDLAAGCGAVLDIGCGTGRVALDLAAHGHAVVGLDSDPELLARLSEQAAERGLPVRTATADARSFSLGEARFALAIAPMQVVQLLGGPAGRAAMLAAARAHLEPGGVLALALADPFQHAPAETALPPLPDNREQAGWVFSSTPVALRSEEGVVAIDRVRAAVSPTGELTETAVTIRLDSVDPELLEREALAAGYRPLAQRRVPETADHVGSVVVLLELP